ncbi:helix-turn-helix domain-containing protein [Ralstonia pseudosolanacearum]|uniref:helix-turn-helix domain-containing protein n=1 Tax=Ralstonia pseudosolanacearum TaxID=1310165 RepID=UPI000ADCB9F6|nr:helix-turn-helix transcriptional regulator [Ralstonia pseudosolanacearum]
MKMHYGDRLAEERGRLGLSQIEMAQSGGVSARTYAYYESGEREPGIESLNSWHAIGADVLYIVLGLHMPTLLSSEEEQILNGYRKLDERGRSGVLALIGGMQPPPRGGASIRVGGNVGQYVEGNQTGTVNIDMSKLDKKS